MRRGRKTGVKFAGKKHSGIFCFFAQLGKLNLHRWHSQCYLLILNVICLLTINEIRAIANDRPVLIPPDSSTSITQTPDTTTTPAPTPPPENDQRFYVGAIRVIGSTVFSQSELDKIIKQYVARELTQEEVRQVADAITQLYLNQNYLTSRAVVLSAPSPTHNFAVIQVIEGQLSGIDVEGNRQVSPDYIRSRIALGASIPLNTIKLEEQLRLLRLDPLFSNVEASLRPTGKVGQSRLVVRVQEFNPWKLTLSVDNYSPPSVGGERMGIDLRDRNLTGLGDELSAAYYRSLNGGAEIFDFSYQIPVNAMNGKIQLRVAPNNSKITESPFDTLGIRAHQDLYEINYRQPLVRNPRQELALSLGFTHQDGQSFIFNQQPYGFGQGPDANGVSRTSVIKFGQDYVKRDSFGAWSVRSQFNFGTSLLDATTNPEPIPDGIFFSWLGQVERWQKLSEDHLLLIQADLQLTPDSLLPSQQFVIGGGRSVRGYRQNARSGDSGFRVAIEDRITVQRDVAGLPTIQLAPFINLGAVWNQGDNPNKLPDQTFLASAGLGLLWNNALGIEKLNMRLDYGIPFINLKDRGNNAQDDGFSFSLVYQP
jgi:hemolysin activation/secretion protein